MGYLTLVASHWGRGAGLATIGGITLALMLYLLASVAGLAEVVLRLRWLYGALRWAGVAYLAWLALETWRGEGGPVRGQGQATPNPWRLFARGLLANLLNPKVAVFYVALLPGFTNPRRGDPVAQVLSLGAIHIAASLLVHTAVVLAAAGARPTISSWTAGRGRRWLNPAFASGLGAIALWLAWETARTP